MKTLYRSILGISAFLVLFNSQAQTIGGGNIHGNFSSDVQYYRKDTAIGTKPISDKTGIAAYGNLIYTNDNFSAGLRYETYTNAVLRGLNDKYNNSGIPYRFATYSADKLEVTIGNYYDQFGNGLIFRTYEEKTLGIDNAMDGVRVKFTPVKGLILKGIYGKQRNYFSLGDGIVRGGDAELQLNEAIAPLAGSKTYFTIGGSVISKYQKDNDPIYHTPENVAAGAGRFNINRGGYNLNAEYAYKANDPSLDNGYIYKPGNALMLSSGYSQKGFGAVVSAKRLDNMAFRSDRNATTTELNINFLPPISKLQTYQLATIYPFATNPNGEMGLQGEVYYLFRPGSVIGGEYGTNISLNASVVNSIDTVQLSDTRQSYSSDPLKFGKDVYYRDFNIEVSKKINKELKVVLTYINLMQNIKTIPRVSGYIGPVNANIVVADVTYKFTARQTVRTELQSLTTKEDMGNWAQGLIEYSLPGWIVSVYDQYNYGNPTDYKRLHYYNAAVAYVHGATRISIGYGRQREGLLCVGGICRQVPASNGVSLSITSSF